GPEQPGGVHALVCPGERRVGRDVDASVACYPKCGVGFHDPASAIAGPQPEGDWLSGRGPVEPQRGDLVDEGPRWDRIKLYLSNALVGHGRLPFPKCVRVFTTPEHNPQDQSAKSQGANARGVMHERLLCWTDIGDDTRHLL